MPLQASAASLGAQYSFPFPLLTLPEMWLLCYVQEGFCWRPCWRVRFAPICMGVTKSLRSFAFGDPNFIKWRAEGVHDPLFQQCALPWQVSQVVTGCTQSFLLTTLTDKASLEQAYCWQNFGEHMMKREYNNNNNHNMNAIFESHRKRHAGLEWSQSSNIIHTSEVFCFQWVSNYWIWHNRGEGRLLAYIWFPSPSMLSNTIQQAYVKLCQTSNISMLYLKIMLRLLVPLYSKYLHNVKKSGEIQLKLSQPLLLHMICIGVATYCPVHSPDSHAHSTLVISGGTQWVSLETGIQLSNIVG